MVDISAIRLIDLVPPSIRDDPEVQAAAEALEGELQAITAAIPTVLLLPRIDELAEDVINHLAWQFHVDFYEQGLPLERKRALVKQSIDWHRHKGTPYAVEQAVQAVLQEATVQEWFNYNGEPYHFRIQTDVIASTQAIYDLLIKLVNAVKNTRSWLEKIIINRDWSGSLFIGGALYSAKNITIGPSQFVINDGSAPLFVGGVLLNGKSITINPGNYVTNIQSDAPLQFGSVLLSGKTTTIQ